MGRQLVMDGKVHVGRITAQAALAEVTTPEIVVVPGGLTAIQVATYGAAPPTSGSSPPEGSSPPPGYPRVSTWPSPSPRLTGIHTAHLLQLDLEYDLNRRWVPASPPPQHPMSSPS